MAEEFDTCKEFDELLKEPMSDSDDDYRSSGFGVVTAAIFIVSVVAGTGVLILPVAIAKTGWYGIIIIFVIGTTLAYTGILLGRCWIILQERFETYRCQTRYPYAAIGYESVGHMGRITVTILIDVYLIGVSVAFMLIISENIGILLHSQYLEVCSILPMVAVALCPLVWFGTPKDFWLIAVGGAVTTGLACLLLLFSILSDTESDSSQQINITSTPPSVWSIAVGTGFICLVTSGHPTYPTIQHDMKNPNNFSWSVILSSLIVAIYFLPLVVVGNGVYGNGLRYHDSIFEMLQPSPIKTMVILLITLHLICGFVVTINPVFQEIDEFIGIETVFSWTRVVVRTLNVVFILFLASSMPSFSNVLSFLSGTVVIIICAIVPCVLYIKLCTMTHPSWPDRSLSTFGYLKISLIIIGATAVAVVVTVANFKSVGPSTNRYFTFNKPCYIPD